jgi:Fe-Mn family superoxide dismutase
MIEYALRDFSGVKGLKGIPDGLIQAHLKLYEGYVKNINLLRKRLAEIKPGVPEFSELQRRVGFEINGMRLHELYFENLSAGGGECPGAVKEALGKQWGSFEAWREEFVGIGTMRGVGWAILYRDPVTKNLSNHWVGMHEENHPAGFAPVLVMDVWEHAFTGMDRPTYVQAFLANADWDRAGARLKG